MAQKIIIDTDPGVDDAMAIYFALCSPELDVVGLTTIFGNVHTSLATTNALRLLEIANRTDILVAKGADNPLTRAYEGPVPYVHGDDGQGNINLDPPTTRALPESAAEFIVEQIMSNPGEITLVPVGPLTNIALALRLEPRIAQNVKEVVIMGGNAFVPGNASPAGEANIRNDPEAADLVFGADWQLTMVGLDVTHKVLMLDDHLAEYSKIQNVFAQHIAKIVPFYRNFFHAMTGIEGIFVHDSSAIAYVIDPTLFTVEQYPMRVATQGLSRGKTWPDIYYKVRPHPDWQNRPLVNVCVQVDGQAVVDLELARIREA